MLYARLAVICSLRADPHSSRAIHMSFMDGSMRKVGLYELWTVKWHSNAQPNHDVVIPWLPR